MWMQIVPGHIARREWVVKGMPDWVGPTPENPLGGGYNAIFIPRGDTRTLAEIPPKEAMLIGYREPNFCALIKFLRDRAVKRVGRVMELRRRRWRRHQCPRRSGEGLRLRIKIRIKKKSGKRFRTERGFPCPS